MILDFDLADLYGTETRVLNQAVYRNKDRFPEDFMFLLSDSEWSQIMSQFVISSQKRRKKTSEPYTFTEHGATMLASVLRSETAVKMNIAIVRAFIAMRKSILDLKDVSTQLEFLRNRITNHDVQLNEI